MSNQERSVVVQVCAAIVDTVNEMAPLHPSGGVPASLLFLALTELGCDQFHFEALMDSLVLAKCLTRSNNCYYPVISNRKAN